MIDYYFADTYALVEVLRGSKSYERFKASVLYTTEQNLMELAYALLKSFPEDQALSVLSSVRSSVIVVVTDDSDYVRAANFRLRAREQRKNISLIDALGYVVAFRLGVPFLTGDREFQGLSNVFFVK